MKAFDYVSLGVAAIVIAVFSIHAYQGSEQGASVRIQSEQGIFIYPMDQDRTITVSGPLGNTIILITGDEGVQVLDSPCRDKICIAAGRASMSGEWIACLPNRVFIRVEGTDDGFVDAQTF